MKGISFVLILAICVGNIFCHMPEAAAATKRITMTSLYNNGDCLPVEEGDTVTIESLEEWNMFAGYSAEGYDMRGVMVELLSDIQVSPYTFSYDEETMRIGISWRGSLVAAYDGNSGRYYADFGSEKPIYYKWREAEIKMRQVPRFNGIFEGNGHYISGVYGEGSEGGTLFGSVENGQIRNLNLSHYFLGNKYKCTSALCNYFSGKIINCHGSNLIFPDSYSSIGGLVMVIASNRSEPSVETSLIDCSAEVYVFPAATGTTRGGMIGAVQGNVKLTVERCHTSGLIYDRKDGGPPVGGIVGTVFSDENLEIRNCVSEVSIAGAFEIGGVVGTNLGENVISLFNCENRGDISARKEDDLSPELAAAAGGLLGHDVWGTIVIDQCRNTGKINSSHIAGGIVGTAREIEIKNTENVGDVCLEEPSDDSGERGLGGIVGMVEEASVETFDSSVGIRNSFCSGNVMGRKIYAGGLIGALGTRKCSLSIDNVCFYGRVEENVGIILGKVNVASVESLSVEKVQNVYYNEQNISSVSADGTELPACMYPVSETQMSGTEEDTYIGQGDFAQTASLCDALNSWCRAQGESTGIVGWKQGEVFPVLEMDETAKPEKPEPTAEPTPEPTETPTIIPTETPTQKPTEKPTLKPTETPTQKPTLKPTLKPTAEPTPEPTETPTQASTEKPTLKPTQKPTLKPTQRPTLKPTERPTLKPTETPTLKPTEAPTQSLAPIALPTVTPLPIVSPLATLLPAASGKPVVKPTTTPAKTDAKKKKMKAPVFSLKKDRTASGKRYVSIRLKRYQGTYVEIWAGRRRKGRKKLIYSKLKIKKNNIRKVRGVFNFQYAKQKGILVFRIRTYSKKGKKRIYSYKSKGKRIRLT